MGIIKKLFFIVLLIAFSTVSCFNSDNKQNKETDILARDSFLDDESYADYLAKIEIQKQVQNPDTTIFADRDDPDYKIRFENNEYFINSWFVSMNKNGDMIKCEYYARIEKDKWSVNAGVGRVLNPRY